MFICFNISYDKKNVTLMQKKKITTCLSASRYYAGSLLLPFLDYIFLNSIMDSEKLFLELPFTYI